VWQENGAEGDTEAERLCLSAEETQPLRGREAVSERQRGCDTEAERLCLSAEELFLFSFLKRRSRQLGEEWTFAKRKVK
jgi:hypothetical protein